MALPAAVQRALDAADATLQSANAPQQVPPTKPTVTLEELAQQPAANAAVSNMPEPPAITEPQAPAPTTAPAATVDDKSWEARYKTLQGLFNKQSQEVPALRQQVSDLTAKLQEAIDGLNAAAKAKQENPQPAKTVVEPADVEAFGQDLVDMVARVTSRAVADLQATAANIVGRVEQLEERVNGATQVATATAEERFFDRVTALVPDWEELNTDERFLAWLAEADPLSGQPRHNALSHARQTLDANRAAAVFKLFKATLPQAPTSSPVEKQVSPRATQATPAPTATQKPVITQQQVNAFYADVRRGVYAGRPDEAARIERVINEALAEGRIR